MLNVKGRGEGGGGVPGSGAQCQFTNTDAENPILHLPVLQDASPFPLPAGVNSAEEEEARMMRYLFLCGVLSQK